MRALSAFVPAVAGWVAHAVLFCADEKSDFITGQTLSVDGGAFTMPNWPY